MDHPSSDPSSSPHGWRRLAALWFGVSLPVGQAAYAASGIGLMVFKYTVEASAIELFTGRVFWPWDFINPLLSSRAQLLQGAPEFLGWGLCLWSLPFLWIAVSMSVRRAADAGISPWLGLLTLVPIVNLFTMLVLAQTPTRSYNQWAPLGQREPAKLPRRGPRRWQSASA